MRRILLLGGASEIGLAIVAELLHTLGLETLSARFFTD